MKKVGIFGAGNYGIRALREIGKENVIAFIDSNSTKWGKIIEGIPVIDGGVDSFVEMYPDIEILIAIKEFDEVSNELEKKGISYRVYFPRKVYYGNRYKLLVNPYEDRKMQLSESDVNYEVNPKVKQELENHTRAMAKQQQLFNHIEIETYNRCNGGCAFCPVSVKNEKRKECYMEEEMFYKIINELASLQYEGNIALFSNNEPFLDRRIIDFCKIVRSNLPFAKTHLYTNGTVLTLEKFCEVIDSLDELIIDNYNTSLQLIKNVRDIYEYCNGIKELEEKVTIMLRNPQEVLETRGGYSPNRAVNDSMKELKCTHPFRQMIIRPDGKVSICCNDALGITCMGDLNDNSLYEIWYGEEFCNIRKLIDERGRGAVDFCKYCDSVRLV